MAAPNGNRFWEARSSHGRKPEFESHEDLWDACAQYFQWVDENPLQEAIVYQGELNEKQAKPLMRAMTLDGLCIFLGITDQTWYNYKKRGDDFLEVITMAESIMRTQKFQGASAGLLNANIISRDLGLKESTEHDHKSSDGSMSPKEITAISPIEAAKQYQEIMEHDE